MARVVTRPVAIITGSASGIGLASMRRAAEVGYQAVRFEVAERRPPVAVAVGAAGSPTERPFASIGDDLWSEDGIRVNPRAVGDTVLFLGNDKEGHLRGQVIRIPSAIAT